jgi:hypothetical protein
MLSSRLAPTLLGRRCGPAVVSHVRHINNAEIISPYKRKESAWIRRRKNLPFSEAGVI